MWTAGRACEISTWRAVGRSPLNRDQSSRLRRELQSWDEGTPVRRL